VSHTVYIHIAKLILNTISFYRCMTLNFAWLCYMITETFKAINNRRQVMSLSSRFLTYNCQWNWQSCKKRGRKKHISQYNFYEYFTMSKKDSYMRSRIGKALIKVIMNNLPLERLSYKRNRKHVKNDVADSKFSFAYIVYNHFLSYSKGKWKLSICYFYSSIWFYATLENAVKAYYRGSVNNDMIKT
jgi:hypothetical protein